MTADAIGIDRPGNQIRGGLQIVGKHGNAAVFGKKFGQIGDRGGTVQEDGCRITEKRCRLTGDLPFGGFVGLQSNRHGGSRALGVAQHDAAVIAAYQSLLLHMRQIATDAGRTGIQEIGKRANAGKSLRLQKL